MKEKEYDGQKAMDYAKKWEYNKNPNYYNFDSIRFIHIEGVRV